MKKKISWYYSSLDYVTSLASALASFFLRVAIVLSLPVMAQEGFSNQIMAVVGEEAITLQDVEIRMKFIPLISASKTPTKEEALNQLIKESVKIDAGSQLKVQTEKSETDIIRNQILERMEVKEKDYLKFIKEKSITLDSMERYVYANTVWSRLLYGLYGEQIEPTEIEIRNATEGHIRKMRRMSEWEIGLLTISKERKGFQRVIAQITNQISPQNFETLARKFSNDQSRARDGYTGWQAPNDVKITLALENTQIGQVSNPVETEKSVIFFKIYNKRKALPPLDLEWAEIILPEGRENEAVTELRQKVRNCHQLDNTDFIVFFEEETLSKIGEPKASILAELRKNQFSKTQILPNSDITIYLICDKKFPANFIKQIKNQIALEKEQLYSKRLYQTFYGKVSIIIPNQE